MGCLKVDITPVSGNLAVHSENTGGISVFVQLVRKGWSGIIDFIATLVSGIVASVSVLDTGFRADIVNKAYVPEVTVGIVCQTNIGSEFYLQVLDGDLMTIDCCFLKVMRDNG